MSGFVFMLLLTVGAVILGVALGAVLFLIETWGARRRIKKAQVYRIKF